MENKAHQQQIKKLQGDLLAVDIEANKGESTQKILAENRKHNPIAEEKIKDTCYTAYSSIIVDRVREKKEMLTDELSDCKAKLLNFVDERKEWDKEKSLLVEDVKALKEKQYVLEK